MTSLNNNNNNNNNNICLFPPFADFSELLVGSDMIYTDKHININIAEIKIEVRTNITIEIGHIYHTRLIYDAYLTVTNSEKRSVRSSNTWHEGPDLSEYGACDETTLLEISG